MSMLETFDRLQAATSRAEVTRFSKQLKRQLAQDDREAVAALKRLAEPEVRALLPLSLVDGGFYSVDAASYSEQGERRLALFIAFVQDYRQADPQLEERVLVEVEHLLQTHHLLQVVADISVNAHQRRLL